MPCHYGTASAFGKLAIECVDTPVELLPLSPDVRKKQAYPRRYPQGVIAQYLRKTPPEAEPSLRHRDPTLEKKTADLIDQCGAVPNQAFAGAMDRLQVQLGLLFQRHEAYSRAPDRFGNCLSIAIVVLVRLDIGPNILRWYQSNIVSLRTQPMPQMVRPAARFQANAAGGKVGGHPQNLIASQLAAKQNLATLIECHHGKPSYRDRFQAY